MDLLREDLNQLVKLLELTGHYLKQLLKVHQLLLFEELQLLELLRHDLQPLQDLLERLYRIHLACAVTSEDLTLKRLIVRRRLIVLRRREQLWRKRL